MSDTPRTDELVRELKRLKGPYWADGVIDILNLAQTMERELAAAQKIKPGLFSTTFTPPLCMYCGKPCTENYYMISGAEGVKVWHTSPGSLALNCPKTPPSEGDSK